jgi:hypothetical protein
MVMPATGLWISQTDLPAATSSPWFEWTKKALLARSFTGPEAVRRQVTGS